jgi:DNA repair protein RecO (recombination protein O)
MSIEQCRSVILSATPYRETSLLLYLFSREHGRLHGIAKGVRRADRRSVPLERGYVIDHFVYIGRQRDLHLITDCALRDHFPAIRGDIEKTAVRDVLLDLLLAAIKDTGPHPEMYEHLEAFLDRVDKFSTNATAELLLYCAKTVLGVAAHLGFGIDFTACAGCGAAIPAALQTSAALSVSGGTMYCRACASVKPSGAVRFLPGAAIRYFSGNEHDLPAALPPAESLMLLHCAIDYCRHHADVRRPLGALGFIDSLF